MSVSRTFIRFGLVGTAGFVVDALVLKTALLSGADFYSGRAVSFCVAVTTTWYLNRIYTFKSRDPRLFREWGKFVSANAYGGVLNYLTYAILVARVDWFAGSPVAAVAVGSIVGLVSNFLLSHNLVFTQCPQKDRST